MKPNQIILTIFASLIAIVAIAQSTTPKPAVPAAVVPQPLPDAQGPIASGGGAGNDSRLRLCPHKPAVTAGNLPRCPGPMRPMGLMPIAERLPPNP